MQQPTYTRTQVARMAGVSAGGAANYAFKLLLSADRAEADLPENALKIKKVLDQLGITTHDLVQHISGKRHNAATAKQRVPLPVQDQEQEQEQDLDTGTPQSLPAAELESEASLKASVVAWHPRIPQSVCRQSPEAAYHGTGVKYDAGKLRLDLIPPEALRAMGEVLTHGADKYGDRNWEQGIAVDRVYAALLRHLLAWREGEAIDRESGLPHLAHALTNAGMLLSLERRAAAPA